MATPKTFKAGNDVTRGSANPKISLLGRGLPGSGGWVPRLEAAEARRPFHIALRLTRGLGGASGVLLMSTTLSGASLFGGDFYVDLAGPWERVLFNLHGPCGIAGAGHRTFALARLPRSPEVVLQAALLDPEAPEGISLSNALLLIRGG